MSSSQWEERLQHEIGSALYLETLRKLRLNEQQRLMDKVPITPIPELYDALNGLHDEVIEHALKLAENEMARLGFGAPPVPYAYFLYGSGGRREQTATSDQDSGIVYAEPAPGAEEQARAYFHAFGQTAVDFLVRTGYPPCEGNVISSNELWCMSLAEWESKIDGYFNEPSWENVRYLLIIADGRKIAGDDELAVEVMDRFFTDMLEHPVISRRMMENTLRYKVLVGAFGQLLRERYGKDSGSLDIKYGAYIPMVNACRLMAVQAGIRVTNTLDRIEALKQKGALSEAEAGEMAGAFALILRMRLLTLESGKVPAEQLTKELTRQLKKALKVGKKMQRKVEREWHFRFGGR